MRPMMEEEMTELTVVTGHTPRPAQTDMSKCAVCGRKIRQTSINLGVTYWAHRDPPQRNGKGQAVGFDANRQKELYERLDAIAGSLRAPQLALPDLFELLSTLHDWRMSPQVWNALDRWMRAHGGSRRRGV